MRNDKVSSGPFIFPCPLILFLLSQPILPGTAAENRVVNGTDVNPAHKYPWAVILYFAGCFDNGFCPNENLCGGSVLNEHFILTAAHCCFPEDPSSPNVSIEHLFVLTGVHERNKLEPWSQNLSIAECIVHELHS